MVMLIAFNKPYGVLSQFTPPTEAGKPVATAHRALSEFGLPKQVYPAGRLDADSEGLLLLTDEPGLISKLLDPGNRHPRTYWAQVENIPSQADLDKLANGVMIEGRRTLPAKARILDPQPDVPERSPPIRARKDIPTRWIELELVEGRNRQVRKMTAAIGFPTLRLVRVRIGKYRLPELAPGKWKALSGEERLLVIS
jgi:23S rRNA pseudouridine2457 synthase